MSFKKNLQELKGKLELIIKKEMDLSQKTKNSFDFKSKKLEYYKKELQINISNLKEDIKNIESNNLNELRSLIDHLEKNYIDTKISLDIIKKLMKFEIKEKWINITNIPYELKENIKADLEEIQKCYENECYRSAVIMCGRVLEIVLHRKYYEVTKKDILETNPSIGLGKLIAKIKEKDIEIDPGLTQQIHLVNQIRINSVHVKKKMFHLTKEQTQAIILYTQDIIKKMFRP